MEKYIALAILVLAYVLFIFWPQRRAPVAFLGALLLVISGVLTPVEAFFLINWNVMGVFVGTLILAELFMWSRVPAYVAEGLVNRSGTARAAILWICAMSGFISIFVENVATLLIVAPIAFEMARKLKISPVNFLIAIAISANLQGTATLIGDPVSMLVAGYAKMTFNDFFVFQGRPSIFFAIQIGAVASFFVLYAFFRPYKQRVEIIPQERVLTWVPMWFLVTMLIALALSSFFDPGFGFLAGIICMVWGIGGLIWYEVAKPPEKTGLWELSRKLDWGTTLFLMGIFVIVGGLEKTGWIDQVAELLAHGLGTNAFWAYIVIVGLAMVLAAFVDNLPIAVAMIPVTLELALRVGAPEFLLVFGLLIGVSLGGNITPIAAAANIVACGQLKEKVNHVVRFREFMRLGVPFTLASVIPAAIFIWLMWG